MSDVVNQLLQIIAVDKAQAAFDSVTHRVSKLDVAFGEMLGHIAERAAEAFVEFAKEAFRGVKELDDLHISTGIAEKSLAAMEVQSKLAGTSLEQVARGSVKLGQAVQDAITGKTTPAVLALHALGVTNAELTKVQNDSVGQFKLLAEAQGKWADGSKKAADIADIFGGKNVQMLRLLHKGAEGFDEAAAFARKFGLELSDIQVQGLIAANDAVDLVELSIKGLARQVAAGLAPTITALANTFLGAGADGEDMGVKLKGAFDKVNFVIGVTLDIVQALEVGFKILYIGAVQIGSALAGVAADILEVSSVMSPLLGSINAITGGKVDDAILALRGLAKDGFDKVAASVTDLNAMLAAGPASQQFLERVSAAQQEAASAAAKLKLTPTAPPPNVADPAAEKALQAERDRLLKRDAARKEALGKELESVSKSLETQQQVLRDAERANLQTIDDANKAKILSDEQAAQLRLAVQEKYNADVAKLNKEHDDAVFATKADFLASVSDLSTQQLAALHDFNKQNTLDQASTMTGVLSTVFSTIGAHSKRAFALAKAFAIAEAIINTAKGITVALATYPYPYSLIVAAAVLASGVAQIAKIRSAQPGGGSAGSVGGSGAGGGVGSTSTGGTTTPTLPVKQGPTVATVILQGHGFTRDQAIEMLDALNEVLGDGAHINIQQQG